jgi:hypothetical protein
MASGRLGRRRAVSLAVRGIKDCTRSSHPAAVAASSSDGQSHPLKAMDGGRKSFSRSMVLPWGRPTSTVSFVSVAGTF